MLTTPVPDPGLRAPAQAAPTDAAASEDAAPVVAMPAAAPVIVLEDVARRYGAVEALVDVDLRIAPGEFVVVLGPSGSGKTTLLNLIGALDTPSEGAACPRTLTSLTLPTARPSAPRARA